MSHFLGVADIFHFLVDPFFSSTVLSHYSLIIQIEVYYKVLQGTTGQMPMDFDT